MKRIFRKEIAKKLIAVLCILVVMQSYFSSFFFVVKAIDTSFDGEIVAGKTNEEEIIAGEETSDEIVAGTNEEEQQQDEQEIVAGENGEESEEPEEPEDPEEVIAGESSEEELKTPEEPAQEQNPVDEEITVGEEEEYVEPEAAISVTSEDESIYKGYLYANATSALRYATNYNTIDVIEIKGGKNMVSLTVQDEADKFGLITNTKIALLNDMYYRQSRISVEEFKEILGEDGEIKLYGPNGEYVGSINKQTPVIEEEYVYEYTSQMNSIKFELSNIKHDGKISIKNDKAIKESSLFSRNQISLFSSINTMTEVNVYVEGQEVRNYKAEGNINLEETESKMTLEIDKDNLSVEDSNDIAINVTLKTDEEKYDLFENPSIDLEFPSAVENVEVTAINLLYKNGLSLDNWNVYTNAAGKQAIKINLTGSQEEYTPGAIQEGTTVVVYTSVDVDRLTADTSENLKLTYTNKDTIRKSYLLEDKESEDVTLNFVGRQELLRAMTVAESAAGSATTYDEDTQKIKVQAESEVPQIVTINGSIVNNYETTVEEVVIIGRIPFVGNKDGNGNEMGTNFDCSLVNGLSTTGKVADIYYSEDGEAKAEDDSWTQATDNIGAYKSYKIVIREGNLLKAERLSFDYNISVPANVGYNAKAYSTYTVYYKIDNQNYSNICSIGIVTDEKDLDLEDIEEEAKEQVAELTIGTQVSQGGRILSEGDSVYERQVVKYTVVVKNTSNVTATNVVIRGSATNSNIYDWEYIDTPEGYFEEVKQVRQMKEYTNQEKEYSEFVINSLAPGESKTFEYQVIVKKLNEIENKEVDGIIKVTANNIDEKNLKLAKLQINKAELEVLIENDTTESIDGTNYETNSIINLKSKIKNISDSKIEKINYTIKLENVSLLNQYSIITENNDQDTEVNYEVIEETDGSKTILFTINNIDVDEEVKFYYTTIADRFEYTKSFQKLMITSYVETKSNKYYSNDFSKKVYQNETQLEYKWNSNIEKDSLNDGEEIKYSLLVNNVGLCDSEIINIESVIPAGLEIIGINIYKEDENDIFVFDNSNDLKISLIVKANEEKTVDILARVNSDYFEKDQDKIEFGLNVYYNTENFKTDIISYNIQNSYISSNIEVIEEKIQDETLIDNSTNIEDETLDNNISNQENISINNLEDNYEKVIETNESNKENVIIAETNIDNSQLTTKQVSTYNISGKVWLDKNKNGICENIENGKEAVIVYLYKATSEGGIDTSNQVTQVVSNVKGEYQFTKVEEGNYVIVFDYDTDLYNVTKYQVSTAKSNENSDAVSKNITINGLTSVYGLTDVLTISGSSLRNIDIGLIDRNEFDLSLDKSIKSIKVVNKSETRTFDYEDIKNIKLEIKSKDYKSTTLDITYKITVKNEGEVKGYVNKIVDYLPDNVTVDYNNSPGWYKSQDGNLYYNGLVGKEIQPGQTEEVLLTLKKSLANGEAVKIVNAAEIAEYTNSRGLDDIDSSPGSKVENEDDYEKAILIVSISTGRILQNVITILIIIIMIAVIITMFIKVINTKKIYK